MRNILLVFLLAFSLPVFAQLTVREQFEKITTVPQAQKFIDANAPLKPTLLYLSYGRDTALIDKRLLKQNKGDVFSVGYVTYKIIEATETVNYRCSYIFLDGGSLSKSEIEELKKVILKKHSDGVSWEKLSDEYTMDGNNTKGDTGWFFGEEMVPKELQDAVKNHKLNEIFYVDVPERQWNYIVKKTYDDQIKKDITVLRANGR
jgi:parvulin-like peptidyl-prolyl isomerase